MRFASGNSGVETPRLRAQPTSEPTYRWRVVNEGPTPGPWKMLGAELAWLMSEIDAKKYESVTGRTLEKIFSSTGALPPRL